MTLSSSIDWELGAGMSSETCPGSLRRLGVDGGSEGAEEIDVVVSRSTLLVT